MKKILILLLVVICCCGCTRNVDVLVHRGATLSINVGDFTYVQYDGHEYLIWINGGHRGGITHSPKCPCQNK